MKTEFEKEIWYLFKLNRNDFNKADRKIEKVLRGVFEKGFRQGRKEQSKKLIELIKKSANS